MTPATNDKFRNFDDPAVYKESQERNLRDPTYNFVVEFGAEDARIAFNVSTDDVSVLLKEKITGKRCVRWM